MTAVSTDLRTTCGLRAPQRVRLSVGDAIVEMTRGDDDWWTPAGPVPDSAEEVDYGYLIDDSDTPRPDPRSRRQPAGVHQRSRTYDPSAYAWHDQAGRVGSWRARWSTSCTSGRSPRRARSTRRSGRLDHLRSHRRRPRRADAGQRHERRPQLGLRRRAVARGPRAVRRPGRLPAVRGRLPRRPASASSRTWSTTTSGRRGTTCRSSGRTSRPGRNTWGDLVNLDGEGSAEVRRFILDNVRMWLEDYHVDGLRLDAVHALDDDSDVHLLEEMAIEVAALSAHQRRPLTLIAESDLNDPRLVTPREAGGYGLDAQWSDDFHHAVHVALTGETHGLATPTSSRCRRWPRCASAGSSTTARTRRTAAATTACPIDTAAMPTWRLVVCAQNHDQVGNRAVGDRIVDALDDDQLACAALLTLAGPFTPMLFQGEEWAASTPFQFFTSHEEPELAEATAKGRIEEFARLGWDPAVVPDPQDPETFRRSKLDWSELDERPARPDARGLPAARRAAPRAARADRPGRSRGNRCTADEETRLFTMRRGDVVVVVNFGDRAGHHRGGRRARRCCSRPSRASTWTARSLTLPAHAGALLAPPARTRRRPRRPLLARQRPQRRVLAVPPRDRASRAARAPGAARRRRTPASAGRRSRPGRRRAPRPPSAARPGSRRWPASSPATARTSCRPPPRSRPAARRVPAPGSPPMLLPARGHRVEVVADRGVLLGVDRRREPVGALVQLGERHHGACGGAGWMRRNSTAHSGWLTRCRATPPTVMPGSADSRSHASATSGAATRAAARRLARRRAARSRVPAKVSGMRATLRPLRTDRVRCGHRTIVVAQ